MSPITHLLFGWFVAEGARLERRDWRLVAWASVLPDLDGVGAVVDVTNQLLHRPAQGLYEQWHHWLLHGLPAAVIFTGVLLVWARHRWRVGFLALVSIHLHLVCDLVGSRGPGPLDIWPLHYLGPVSDVLTLAWPGQWALNAWPNIALTLGLLGLTFWCAVVRGRSIVGVFSYRADALFVATVRRRWRWGEG